MLHRLIIGMVAIAVVATSGVSHAAIVVRGEIVPVTEGSTGNVEIGIFVTSTIDTTILSYNLPTLLSNASVASFVSYEATDFGFGTENATALAPSFTADFGLAGAAGSLTADADQSVQIGALTFIVISTPPGVTTLSEFIDTGFDANFFQFNTADGIVSATNGLASIGTPAIGIQTVAIPEPSSAAVLGILSFSVGAIRAAARRPVDRLADRHNRESRR